MTTCTIDDCTKPVKARGACTMHYKRMYEPRPKKSPTTCDGCGIEYLVERPSRGKTHHCSELCRQWSQFGAWSCVYRPPRPVKIITPRPTRQINCGWCATPLTTTNSRQVYCCKKHGHKHKASERRAREFNSIGTYTWADVTRLWLLFDKTCAYCSTPTPLTAIQAEHVIALSRGGANNISNLLPSCGPCNSDKRDLSLTEWATERARFGKPPVRTAWADTDTRFAHLSYMTSQPQEVAA